MDSLGLCVVVVVVVAGFLGGGIDDFVATAGGLVDVEAPVRAELAVVDGFVVGPGPSDCLTALALAGVMDVVPPAEGRFTREAAVLPGVMVALLSLEVVDVAVLVVDVVDGFDVAVVRSFEASVPVVVRAVLLAAFSSPDVKTSASDERPAGRRAAVTGGLVGGLFKLLPGVVRVVEVVVELEGFAFAVAVVRDAVVEVAAPGLFGAAAA
ncbi:MAG: hypothetical protein INR71_09275, partial [Terriglobus roseus]|nr:hypothetical protein [Terriglobus roseus]